MTTFTLINHDVPTFIQIANLPEWREENLVNLNKDKRTGVYNLIKKDNVVEFWYEGHEGHQVIMVVGGYTAEHIDSAIFLSDGCYVGNMITAQAAAIVQLYFYLKL